MQSLSGTYMVLQMSGEGFGRIFNYLAVDPKYFPGLVDPLLLFWNAVDFTLVQHSLVHNTCADQMCYPRDFRHHAFAGLARQEQGVRTPGVCIS